MVKGRVGSAWTYGSIWSRVGLEVHVAERRVYGVNAQLLNFLG